MKIKREKLGIIQSRGLGDIFIALPIAYYYHCQDRAVYWPICTQWVEEMTEIAPWCTWIPVTPDRGEFFYDRPLELLKQRGCEEIIPLYQALSGHREFLSEPYFQHVSFDQYKYLRAGVPFSEKWQLADCISRSQEREQALYDRVRGDNARPYIVTHLTASESTVELDPGLIPELHDVVPITNEGYLTDWLTVIERAAAIVMTDSSMANIVDQLKIPVEKYFIPLHHIQLTPVHTSDWIWLDNPKLNPRARIFTSN
jgi:hypothetical protein